MNKITSVIALISVLIVNASCIAQPQLGQLEFIIGTWKVENKTTYESWEKQDDNTFTGVSYKIKDGQKMISETLGIVVEGDKVTYIATVPDQNNGQTISFELNTSVDGKLSFENLSHDFPKKIQYQSVDDHKVFVRVLGDGDEGFSYNMIRQ